MTTDDGMRLRLAEDATGETLWSTADAAAAKKAAKAVAAEVERLKALLGDRG